MTLQLKTSNYTLTKILSFTVILIGSLVIVGWITDNQNLQSIVPTWVTMKFATSISFVMSGVIIYLINEIKIRKSEFARLFLLCPMIVILFFTASLLISFFIGSSTGIESIFVKETDAVSSSRPGMPSFFTMINFMVLYFMALIFLNIEKQGILLKPLSLLLVVSGIIAIIGYVIDVPILYYDFGEYSSAMAIHTSITFIVMGISIFLISINSKIIPKKNTIELKLRDKILLIFIPSTLVVMGFMIIINSQFSKQEITPILLEHLQYKQIPTLLSVGALIFHAAFFLSKSIIRPIKNLADLFDEVENGNLKPKITIESHDEIGELTISFKKMTESLLQSRIILDETNKELALQLEEISRSDKLKEEFASMVTHELKTPLTPIKGYCEMLKDPDFGKLTKEQIDNIDEIYRNAVRLETLIIDILDSQKLDMRKMKFNKSYFKVSEFLKQTEKDLMSLGKDKNITLQTYTMADNTVYADKGRLRQVMDNIIKNAIDFVSNDTGKIEIGANQVNNHTEFYVKDNGIGIPKNKQSELFQKFYQIDTSLTRKHGGTGLGLVICKGIVEAHGGKIWLDSEEGKGTTFYFTIPNGDK